jgi:vacuolar iron transporter family protein
VALAGVAGLVGGAFSMAAGEYISVQSQNEATDAELAVERRELERNPEGEEEELAQAYVQRGVDLDVARTFVAQLHRDPDQAFQVHVQEELGVDPGALPSPWIAALSSLLAFSVGAIIPLLPYLLGATTLAISAVLAVVALFTAGAVSSRFTSRGLVFAGVRQLLVGVFAAAVTFGIGALFHTTAG